MLTALTLIKAYSEVTQKNNACMAGLIRLCTNNMLSISCFSELKLYEIHMVFMLKYQIETLRYLGLTY